MKKQPKSHLMHPDASRPWCGSVLDRYSKRPTCERCKRLKRGVVWSLEVWNGTRWIKPGAPRRKATPIPPELRLAY